MSEDVGDDHPRKRVKLEESVAESGETRLSIEQQAVEDQLEQERKFGITAFVTEIPGFSCILKQRYTDFLVNEIEPSGKVVHLEQDAVANVKPAAPVKKVEPKINDDAKPSEETPKDVPSGEATSGEVAADIPTFSLSESQRTELEAIFGAETTTAIADLYNKILAKPNRKAKDHPQHTSGVIDDKQKRTDAHVAVRKIFNARIDTITLDDNRIHIKAASPSKQNGRSPAQRGDGPYIKGKVGWEELGGEYVHFSLYKENKDTMEVCYFLGSQMKMHTKNFQFAGTKDRRGVTTQRVSLYRVTKERLASLNRNLRQARLSGFEYKNHGLQLGDLAGNEFTIVLRDCQPLGGSTSNLADIVAPAVEALRTNGFLNYFGLQRFGSFSTSTDEIGKRMLKGDLKGAVEGLLLFSPATLVDEAEAEKSKISRDDMARAQALDIWNKTHKTGATIEKLPRRFQAENAIVRHLGHVDKRSGQQLQLNDWQGALKQITRNLRLMYVHAYQSLVWNAVAAKRRELYGGDVVEGDLVIVEQKAAAEEGPLDDVDENGEVIIRPTGDNSATSMDDKFERARPLSAEEAASGKYSIFDIVLPLPGYDVAYPANAVGEYYMEFMGKDGLDPHNMRRSWKDISLSGSYRKVMGRAEALSHELISYSEADEQLALTDMDRLEGKTELTPTPGANSAVVVRMQLGTSQYATMALRELTKGGALAFKPDYSGER